MTPNQKPSHAAWAFDALPFSQFSFPYLLNCCICSHFAKAARGTAIPLRTGRVAAATLPLLRHSYGRVGTLIPSMSTCWPREK